MEADRCLGWFTGTPVVALNGNKLDSWTFGPNNVLAWEDEAGHTAWLQFVHLAEGPVFMGNLHKPDETSPERESLPAHSKAQIFLDAFILPVYLMRVACCIYINQGRLENWHVCTGFNVFGELKGQHSRLSPTSVMDAVVGEKVAAGLGVASTLLLAEVLQSAMR